MASIFTYNRKLISRSWLFSPAADVALLLLPVWACWAWCFSLTEQQLTAPVPLWVWVLFVLGLDVGHVWSTIYRTYLDKQEFQQHKQLLRFAPLIAFSGLFAVAAVLGTQWFWRVLAYIALFHFMKQQFGFLALYKARNAAFERSQLHKALPNNTDKYIIYFSMLYPVLYWHLSPARNFNWFVYGDFFNFSSVQLSATFWQCANMFYFAVLGLWLLHQLYMAYQLKEQAQLPWGKWLWVFTTAGNWYLGIVYFNSDIAFTVTNVVAHGLPYLVLVSYYQAAKKSPPGQQVQLPLRYFLRLAGLIVLTVSLLAFAEEYLWEILLNREKQSFFGWLPYPQFITMPFPLAEPLFLALLSVPQAAHYIIDAYIWKGKKNPEVGRVLVQ